MFRTSVRTLALLISLVLLLTVGGVYAIWMYFDPPDPVVKPLNAGLTYFRYPDIYIIDINPVTDSGTFTKSGDTTATANIASGGASFAVTFYNGSDITYYYNKADTKIDAGKYTVTDIEKKDPVLSKDYKTITVSFSDRVSGDIFFHFVVNPDEVDVESIVARTAVDRFREILNTATEYTFLTDAMDAYDDDSSKVTYIGNVVGSNASDSGIIKTLFGDDFMSMDLDGKDGAEPITMMIKRENLDGDESTGDSYSYTTSNWFNQTTTTINGAEMTLYITAHNLDAVDRGDRIVVYAAVFTKYEGTNEWVELVPLTKGTAAANNYNGSYWGDANSFNTDTWVSDRELTLRQIIAAQN